MSESYTPMTPPPSYAPPTTSGPDAPEMSTPETLANIFFEPGRTFEALRARPRFVVATLLTAAMFLLFTVLVFQKINYNDMVRAAIESSPQTAQMTDEQKERAIEMQSGPIFKTLAYAGPVISIFLVLAVGAGIYLLGTMAMGKAMTYQQALAVWAYSSFPPVVLMMLANIIILFVNPPDVSEAATATRGLVHANLSLLVNRTEQPVLATLLGTFDLFKIYGLFLAAIGLQKIARLSAGAAWTVVIVITLIGALVAVIFAAVMGQPMA
ncbi:MAG: YIP1 family protein [Pyrinomonadaceae bacterium]|nr:YIP1 family protein [Pyrinomonadaceae bacterium]